MTLQDLKNKVLEIEQELNDLNIEVEDVSIYSSSVVFPIKDIEIFQTQYLGHKIVILNLEIH